MGYPNDGAPFGGSVPPTPSPPVTLSDLLAQRPFPSPYSPTCERPVTSPDTTLGAADEHSILVVASGDGTQVSPGQQDRRDPLAQDNMSSQTGTTPPTRPVASSSDWLAKRNQLRPSRNQGSKGDWIRGWSEDVGVYGTETYCGCSESSFVGDQTLVVKGGEIKSGVRGIWLGRKQPSNSALNGIQHPSRILNAAMCRNCSRAPSPSNSATGNLGGMADEPHKKVGIIQKLNGLIQKAKPRWGQDTYKKYLSKTKSHAALEARLDQALGADATASNRPYGFLDTRQPRTRCHGQRNPLVRAPKKYLETMQTVGRDRRKMIHQTGLY